MSRKNSFYQDMLNYYNSFFNRFFPDISSVEYHKKDNNFCLDLEVPGFCKEELTVEFFPESNVLRVHGKTPNKTYEKYILLTSEINTEPENTELKNGVLSLTWPVKSKTETCKKLEVK